MATNVLTCPSILILVLLKFDRENADMVVMKITNYLFVKRLQI